MQWEPSRLSRLLRWRAEFEALRGILLDCEGLHSFRYSRAKCVEQVSGNNRKDRKTFFQVSGFTRSVLAHGPRLAHGANRALVGRDRGSWYEDNATVTRAQHGPTVCHVGVIEIGRRGAAPSVNGFGPERGPQEWRLTDVH